MRIVYSYDMLLPGTSTDMEQVVNTVAALGRAGIDVTLAVPRRPDGGPSAEEVRTYFGVQGPFSIETFPRRLAGSRGIEKPAHALAVARSRLAREADLLYTRNLPGLAALVAHRHRVVYEHFRPWPRQYPPLQPWLRYTMRRPNFLGAVLHSAHAAAAYEAIGVPHDRILVAHNGYDPATMVPELSRRQARALVDLPVDRPLVVYVGRVNDKKGLDVVLQMARNSPDITYALVGSEGDGPIERQAAALPNVIVRDWQPFDQLRPYLYAADVLIVPPSRAPLTRHKNTVLPMKLFRYLAVGRPILAPIAPDTAELLRDDDNAGLVPPGEPTLAVAWIRSVLADRERWDRLAAAARATGQDLTWDARAAKIVEFLERRRGAEAQRVTADDSGWTLPGWLGATARWLRARD